MDTRPSHRPALAGAVFARGMSACGRVVAVLFVGLLVPVAASAQLFDFDSAPVHSGLPLDQTVGSVTAHFSCTGAGFSIQPANQMGFTPVGFGGLCIYPNSINAADLLISFSATLKDFSIMYAPQELGCDNSAVMRVTAYMDGVLRGTATTTAPQPGTWPVGTLSYSDLAGFNSVVVHYDQRPACTDWGPIFMADNMNVTELTTAVPWSGAAGLGAVVSPNPFRAATELRLQLPRGEALTVTVHDVAGRLVRTLGRGAAFEAGFASLPWDGRDDAGIEVGSGVYFCRVTSEQDSRVIPMIRMR